MENKLAGVWVKASERLPDVKKYFNGRLNGKPAIVINSALIKDYITANGNLEPVAEVEWLDEGQQLQSQQQEDKVIEEVKEYMNDLDSYFQEDKIPDEAIEKLESDYAKSKIDWAEKLYNHLKHIYDSYGDDWNKQDQKVVADLLYYYQTKDIP